jgi:hypothetical protein
MDRHERFYRRSLREILVAQGVLTSEIADELAESAYEASETFGHAVVDAGHMTSWELAKVVASHYQMPVLPLAGFDFDASLLEGLSPATLFQHQVVPVGRFGQTWSFAVVEPPSRDCVAALRESCGNAIFFFAAEAEAVQKLITDHVKVVDATADKKWQSLFDAADEAVQQDLGPEQGGAQRDESNAA